MKHSKKIIMLFSIVFSMHLSAAPKNKQQIFLTNEYGQDVMVKLVWKSENFPYFSQDNAITLREHDKNFMIKAPYSFYKFIGLTVHPQNEFHENSYLESEEQDFEIPLIASNEDSLDETHVRNNSYFIIKASPKNSAIPGQKKIYIQGYASQQKYVSEITKIEQKIKAAPVQEPQIVEARIMVAPQQQPQQQPQRNIYDYQREQAPAVVMDYAKFVDDEHQIEKPIQQSRFNNNNNRHRRENNFVKKEPVSFRNNIPTKTLSSAQEEDEDEEYTDDYSDEEVFNPMHLATQEPPQELSLPKPLKLPYTFKDFN